ncbi:MAG TPA: ABC transporter substrate-binding protein [Burkholderiaceae bacterium]|jgi:NitT/TauT family transport system substrate-binding protein
MKKKSYLILAALLILGMSSQAHASDEKITIMVGGLNKLIYLPVKLAEQLGYFSDENIQVEFISEHSGVHAEDELLAGAAQGVIGFYDHTIDLQARGKFVQSVVQFSQAPGEVEVVSKNKIGQIQSPADFKGMNIGVTGLGSSTHFLTLYLASAKGVKPNEFKVIPVGSGTVFINAMKRGKIDAGMTTEPTLSRLLKNGDAKILIDLRSPDDSRQVLGGLYPGASLYMPTFWIEKHKIEVQKLVNALVKSLRYIHTHTPEEIASNLPSSYFDGDRPDYIRALAEGKVMFTGDGKMPESGPETVLRILMAANRGIREKNIDLSKTYTTQFTANVK